MPAAGDTGHLAAHGAGLTVVQHGSTAATARPNIGSTAALCVLWEGTVAPTNAITRDLWWDETNLLLKRFNGTAWDSAGSAAYGPRAAAIVVAPAGGVAADYICTGTNDHTTINTAIAALPALGGRVLLLAGQYNLNGEILIQRSNVTLEGEGFGFWGSYAGGNPGTGVEGVGITKLKQTSASARGIHIDNTAGLPSGETRQHGITISNLYLYGGGSTGAGIYCNDASPAYTDQLVIEKVFVHKFAIGMNIQADAPHITDFTIMDCSSHGLHLEGSNYAKVDNYSISDNGGTGIVVGNAASGAIHNMIGAGELVRDNIGIDAQGPYTEIVGAHVYNCRAGGVKIGGAGSKMLGGVVRSCAGGQAVNLAGDADLGVIGVTILDHSGDNGIGGTGCTRPRIVGCDVQMQSAANFNAVGLSNATDGLIQGNVAYCASSTASGIGVSGTSSNFSIVGNTVTGTWANKVVWPNGNLGILSLGNPGAANGSLCQASVAASATTFTASTWTKVLLDVTDIDTTTFSGVGSMHSTSSNTSRVVAPVTGKYRVVARCQFFVAAGAQDQVAVAKNGATITTAANQLGCSISNAGGSGTVGHAMSTGDIYLNLTAGDYLEMIIFSTSASPQYLGNANNPQMTTLALELVA